MSPALLHKTNDHPMHPKVVVSGVVDYSDKKVQKEMEELLRALENTTFIDPLYTESWLRSGSPPSLKLNITTPGPSLTMSAVGESTRSTTS